MSVTTQRTIKRMTRHQPLPSALSHQPFSVRQGLSAGLKPGRMRGLDLRRPYRGARTAQNDPNAAARAREFQIRSPSNTYICSVTAALLHRIPVPWKLASSEVLHVGVPWPARAPRVAGVIGHKFQLNDEDLCEHRGVRVTTVERTWCDLATQLSLADLVAAGDYIIHWRHPLATLESLRHAMLKHAGRRGNAKLRRALKLLSDRSESPQESVLRVITAQANLRGFQPNVPIRTSGGFRYRGDLVMNERKFILEYQGLHHAETAQYRADMTRISRLEADGWFVMLVNRDDLDNPRELMQRIRTALARRPYFS